MNLASAVSIPGTVAHEFLAQFPSAVATSTIGIEHPGGVLELAVTLDGDAPVGATITSTARAVRRQRVRPRHTRSSSER